MKKTNKEWLRATKPMTLNYLIGDDPKSDFTKKRQVTQENRFYFINKTYYKHCNNSIYRV
jgi:hypothetical protein